MSQSQRAKDFCKGQTDAQFAYIEAERETDQLKDENDRLRKLVWDMWRDGMCECDKRRDCAECEYGFPARLRELGIEVDDG